MCILDGEGKDEEGDGWVTEPLKPDTSIGKEGGGGGGGAVGGYIQLYDSPNVVPRPPALMTHCIELQ